MTEIEALNSLYQQWVKGQKLSRRKHAWLMSAIDRGLVKHNKQTLYGP